MGSVAATKWPNQDTGEPGKKDWWIDSTKIPSEETRAPGEESAAHKAAEASKNYVMSEEVKNRIEMQKQLNRNYFQRAKEMKMTKSKPGDPAIPPEYLE